MFPEGFLTSGWAVVGFLIMAAVCFWPWLLWRQRKRWRDELFTALAILDRWCGGEFPIVEDLTEYLRCISRGGPGPVEDLGAFRDRLRRIYGRDYDDS